MAILERVLKGRAMSTSPGLRVLTATVASLVFISPGAADAATVNAALLAAAPLGRAISDEDMGGLRGAGGLLVLPAGSSTFVQIGATTKSQFQPGTPSSASSALSLGGSSQSASASLGASNGAPSVSFSKTFGQTFIGSNTRAFSFAYTLGF